MATTSRTPARDQELALEARRALMRVRERAWAIATGLVLGLLLALATIVLVARGGPNVGEHLGLLAVYLPGYSVSYGGAVVGFAYAFVFGGVLGGLTGRLYNLFARTP